MICVILRRRWRSGGSDQVQPAPSIVFSSGVGARVAGGQRRRLCRPRRVTPGGFGLLELLVVIAIVLILFTLYWSFSAKDRGKDARLNCSNNLQKIFLAMQIYSNEHSGGFPALPGAVSSEEPLDALVPHYTVDTPVFICPASGD